MQRQVLKESELTEALAFIDNWQIETNVLKKQLKFENFAAALEFVNKVGELAEAADHHPDITFGWGYADIALTTHDRGGITDVDVALAKRIDEI